MHALQVRFNRVDEQLTRWMARNGIPLLRISLGVVFFWFGVLKFFPGLSPAHDLAGRTIDRLSFGLIGPDVSLVILATWECVIGLGLIFGVYLRAVLLLDTRDLPMEGQIGRTLLIADTLSSSQRLRQVGEEICWPLVSMLEIRGFRYRIVRAGRGGAELLVWRNR